MPKKRSMSEGDPAMGMKQMKAVMKKKPAKKKAMKKAVKGGAKY